MRVSFETLSVAQINIWKTSRNVSVFKIATFFTPDGIDPLKYREIKLHNE